MKIAHYSYINSKGIYYNSRKGIINKPFDNLEAIYDFIQPNYPKFYKMDTLSQLGFLLAEELLNCDDIHAPGAIAVWTKHSSYSADMKHIDNILKKINGPANFTYTLPNIVIGEIAIRHHFFGESGLFLSEGLRVDEIITTSELYFADGITKRVIICWLDSGPESHVGFMCDVMADTSNIDIFRSEIENIYNALF